MNVALMRYEPPLVLPYRPKPAPLWTRFKKWYRQEMQEIKQDLER